ncbi:ABC transporter permease [Rhodococcus erythropolis]
MHANLTGGSRSLREVLGSEAIRVWYVLLGVVIVSAIVEPGSLSSRAVLTMLPVAGILAIASLGQSLAIQQGGIDFTAPGIISLAAVLVAGESDSLNSGLTSALLKVLLASVVIGLISGLAVAVLRITPIIATLAINALVLGAVTAYASGSPRQAPPALTSFAVDRTIGIPNIAIIAVVVVLLAVLVQTKTALGRRFVAIGDNPQTSRAVGLPVRRYLVGGYLIAAVFYGVAGVLLAGYVVGPSITSGNPYLLATITAVVVGGTAFGGGRARLIGSAVAALFLSQLDSLLNAISAPPATSLLIQATAIAIVIGLGPTASFLRDRRRLRSSGSHVSKKGTLVS